MDLYGSHVCLSLSLSLKNLMKTMDHVPPKETHVLV